MTAPQPQTAQERWALQVIELLRQGIEVNRLLAGEVSGLRGDVKALRDSLLTRIESTADKVPQLSGLDNPAPSPAKVVAPQVGGGKVVTPRPVGKGWK